MRKACRKIVAMVITCILFTSLFTSTAYAAQYIYYDGGLSSATVDVENRLSYYGVFSYCIGKWNSMCTPVSITQVPGSGHSYCIDGQYDDTWYGLYTPQNRQFVFWGRAGKFKIELNRSTLVNESDTCRKSVLVHEFGHAFCLADNPSSGNSSIMNYDRNRNYLTWPTNNDIAGVNNAY